MQRLEPNAAVIIVATRWGPDDLIGQILANNQHGEWDLLNLPALSLGSDTDPLGRPGGEAVMVGPVPTRRGAPETQIDNTVLVGGDAPGQPGSAGG